MSPISGSAARGLALAALASCATGQAVPSQARSETLPANEVSVVRDVGLQANWVQPVGHLSSAFKRRVAVTRSVDPRAVPTVFVACEELRWTPADEAGTAKLLSSNGWIRQLDLDTGTPVTSVDVGCAMSGYSQRTDMFWDFQIGDEAPEGVEHQARYWIGESCARLGGAVALLSAENGTATLNWVELGAGADSRLGEVVDVGRAPSIDGGLVLWAAAPGFMGDHRSTPATVVAFSTVSSEPLYTLSGGEGFGRQMLAVEDLDGDKHDDLIVSGEWRRQQESKEATSASEWTASLRFAAFSGRTGSILWDHTRIEPCKPGNLTQAADWDGDGLRDIVVAQQVGTASGYWGARLLVLSAKDGQQLREFRPLAQEKIWIGRVAYAGAGASRHRGILAIGYMRDRRLRDDPGLPPSCSGVALLSAETGEELARIEEDDPEWMLGQSLLVVPVGAGPTSALIVTLEGATDRPEGTDYVLRYDLRP